MTLVGHYHKIFTYKGLIKFLHPELTNTQKFINTFFKKKAKK